MNWLWSINKLFVNLFILAQGLVKLITILLVVYLLFMMWDTQPTLMYPRP
jgi:hypothetical protein